MNSGRKGLQIMRNKIARIVYTALALAPVFIFMSMAPSAQPRILACIPTPTPSPTPTPTPAPVDSSLSLASGWTRPEAPTNLTATLDPTSPSRMIHLAWEDHSAKESGYLVERSGGRPPLVV